jgi:hypothetical protein
MRKVCTTLQETHLFGSSTLVLCDTSVLCLMLRFFKQVWHPNQRWSQLIQK